MRFFVVFMALQASLSDAFVIHQTKFARFPQYTRVKSSNESTGPGRISREQEAFMERESKAGADKVRAMSIEERTKRAMLAEAAEDRIVLLSDELDELLGEDGMPKSEEYRDSVVALCRQIKSSQEQYRNLVTGEDSPLLDALNGLGSSEEK